MLGIVLQCLCLVRTDVLIKNGLQILAIKTSKWANIVVEWTIIVELIGENVQLLKPC